MTIQENKAALRRLINEGFLGGDTAVVDELIASDFVDHSPAPGQAPGPEGVKQAMTMFRTAFPDLSVTIEDEVAEGDKVMMRGRTRGTHKGEFMGIAPTGKQIDIGEMYIVRFSGGKMVEHWAQEDSLGMMQQLGVIPTEG